DCFVAELPSLRLNDVRIDEQLVRKHERMLTGGFYSEIELTYDPSIAEERSGRPFGIESLREIQLSKHDALDDFARGRALFSFDEWRDFLLRSVGLRSEEHTSELQSRGHLVCRLLLEKKKNI